MAMTLDEKFRVFGVHLRFMGAFQEIAGKMITASGEQKKKLEWEHELLCKKKDVKIYEGSKECLEEQEFLKTMPKRSLGICMKCEHFAKAKSLLEPNRILRGKYNCEKHSKAVVQEEFSKGEWEGKPIPKDCPFRAESKLTEWNGEEGNEDKS